MKKILSLFVLSLVLFGCGTTPTNVSQIQASDFYGKWQGILQHKDGYDVLVIYEFLPSSSQNTVSVIYREGFPDTGTFNFRAERIFTFTNDTVTWRYDGTTQALYNRTTENQKYTLSETEFELLPSRTSLLAGKLTLIEYNVTKFEGKWVNEERLSMGWSEYSVSFTGDKVAIRATGNGGSLSAPGTFTFTDTTITFIPEQANTWQSYTQNYTLNGNELILEGRGNPNGLFIKQ